MNATHRHCHLIYASAKRRYASALPLSQHQCPVQQSAHRLRNWWRELPHSSPKPSQEPKIEHRGTYESPDATKSTQEAPKRRPRDSAEAPKRVQKLPKSVQVAPKTGPRGPQTPPKTSLGTTKTSLGHDIGAQFQSEGSYNDFLLFLKANAKTIEFALVGGRTQFLLGFSAFVPSRKSCKKT